MSSKLQSKVTHWVALLVVAAADLYAQSGFVRSANQTIPGATVTATEGSSKVVVTADQNGHYSFSPLAKGTWTVEVTMFGFQPARKQVTDPQPAQEVNFNLALKESEFASRLNRFATSQQGGNQLESQIQESLSASQAPASPPAGGQGGNDTFLVAGSLSQGLSANAGPDSGPQLFGGRPGGYPGQPEGGAPNAPGFQEGGGSYGGHGGFYGGGGPHGGGPPHEHGHEHEHEGRPGGTQFGNHHAPSEVHGMAFATLDNSALNAKPFSITGQDIPQPAYAQGRFGVLVGGPLLIPKIVHDQSTFFFLSYFATRAKNPYTAVETVPSLLERQGDFSQSIQSTGGPVTIYDPATHQPFPGNVIPRSRIDPIALGLAGFVPLPNQPGVVNNYQFQTAVAANTDNLGLRLMRNLTKNDRLSYHFTFQRRDGDNAQPYGFLDSTSGSGISTDLSWTHNFSPNLINTLKVTFNRNRNELLPFSPMVPTSPPLSASGGRQLIRSTTGLRT